MYFKMLIAFLIAVLKMSDFDKRHNSLMDWGADTGGDHPELGHYGIPTVKGNFDALPQKVQDFIDENVRLLAH
jgi:hypothetical protein